MAAQGGRVAVVFVRGCYYAGEAYDVRLQGLLVALGIEGRVVPPAAGGVEQIVHAVDKLDQIIKFVDGIFLGHVESHIFHTVGI